MEEFLMEHFAFFGIGVFVLIILFVLLYISCWFLRVNDMLNDYEEKLKNSKSN